MIYLDNAATSHFKPNTVLDAVFYDLTHPANSGRSAHKMSLDASVRIEACRQYLKAQFNADDEYELIFTKNCTEALNIAILGSIKGGECVVSSQNEHNSVLRPLFHLQSVGKIKLHLLKQNAQGKIDIADVRDSSQGNIYVFGGTCNTTGTTLDIHEIGKIARRNNAKLIVDGAQCVPLQNIDVKNDNIDALACPGHKGLHGIQGTGFLIVKKSMNISPLMFGGTGTFSQDILPLITLPDAFEVGTQFCGGISALHKGAIWSFQNIDYIRKILHKLALSTAYNLQNIGAKIYTNEFESGIVAFNIGDIDSTYIADRLDECDICVRAGLHCAPFVHKHLKTLSQGAVRVSIGCDNTEQDILLFSHCIEKIVRQL